jgi:calcium/calmodulin-dependent protein kinase I
VRLTEQVRNEINVLKRVSAGHRHIVSLHDFFETTHNLYVRTVRIVLLLEPGLTIQLVFDLCTGGELFDRICARGSYFEKSAVPCIAGLTGGADRSGMQRRSSAPSLTR